MLSSNALHLATISITVPSERRRSYDRNYLPFPTLSQPRHLRKCSEQVVGSFLRYPIATVRSHACTPSDLPPFSPGHRTRSSSYLKNTKIAFIEHVPKNYTNHQFIQAAQIHSREITA